MSDVLEIARLNNLLGRELGRRADGHPIFKWKNSDDLFWPQFKAGSTETKEITSNIPIIGTSETEAIKVTQVVPTYVRDRQMRQPNVWVITKWMDPEMLIWGWVGRHGGEARPAQHPTHDKLLEMWQARFPGADFPAAGWRVPTDALLPSFPGGPREPNENDTRRFIELVQEQTRLGFDERLADMEASEIAKEAEVDKRIQDEVRDAFPAFLNPVPGKRSNFVSFPWTKRDRVD